MRAHVRRLATSARAYTVRRISPAGSVDRFTASPRDLVDKFGLLPRDCRLLATSNAHIAVRENYFLFRFPPFTGAVRHDAALLIADHDNVIAVETLQQRLVNTTLGGAGAANGGATHTLSFEHKVLDAMLQEDTLHKRDRYARLATLIETATSPTVTSSTGSIIGFYKVREASLYRLLTLSRSLSALGLDVKRSSAALAQLLSSDEDMEGTYLTYRQASGAGQPIDQHTDVELMLESFATEHDDLGDNIEELQDGVSTHRLLEQLKLTNERNGIMRLELLLSFGTCSLALCATVGGLFGMNLHSGIENVHHLLWGVSAGAGALSTGLFIAFVRSMRRFHFSQQRSVDSTAALDRAIDALETAYFALRLRTPQLESPLADRAGAEAKEDGLGSRQAGETALLPITRDSLADALQYSAQLEGGAPLPHGAVDELWEMLDANGDGVLTQEEIGEFGGSSRGGVDSRARRGIQRPSQR